MNYFELFALPLQFQIDKSLLRQRYYQRMLELNEEKGNVMASLRNSSSSSNIVTPTAHKATALNSAYAQLKDDYLRAKYLLQLLDPQEPSNLVSTITIEQFKQLSHWQHILHQIKIKKEVSSNVYEQAYGELSASIEASLLALQYAFEKKDYSEVRRLMPGFEALHALRKKYLALKPNCV